MYALILNTVQEYLTQHFELMEAQFQRRIIQSQFRKSLITIYSFFDYESMVYMNCTRLSQKRMQTEIIRICPTAFFLRVISRIIIENENSSNQSEIQGPAKEALNKIIIVLRAAIKSLTEHYALCAPCRYLSREFRGFQVQIGLLNGILYMDRVKRQLKLRLKQIKVTMKQYADNLNCILLRDESQQSTNNSNLITIHFDFD